MTVIGQIVGYVCIIVAAIGVLCFCWSMVVTKLDERKEKKYWQIYAQAKKDIGLQLCKDYHWLGADISAWCTMRNIGMMFLEGHSSDMWRFREMLFKQIAEKKEERS